MKKQVFKKKAGQALAVAISAALLTQGVSVSAEAANLGRLITYSYLNEPLSVVAVIEKLEDSDISTLRANIMSAADYAKAGLKRPAWADSASVTIKSLGAGRYGVEVSSTQSVSDPAASLLIELKALSGNATREYALLLDMKNEAVRDPLKEQGVVSTGISEKEFKRQAEQLSVAELKAKADKEASLLALSQGDSETKGKRRAGVRGAGGKLVRSETRETGDGSVQVSKGAVLSTIAKAKAPEGVNLDQMMLGFLKQNPNAFVDSNINRLKAGVILRVPSKEEALQTDAAAARTQVAAMTESFKLWRSAAVANAAHVPTQTAADAGTATNHASTGTIEKEKVAPTSTQDELKLSQTDKGGQGNKTTQAEDKIAKQKELQEAKSREAELERTGSELKKLLALRNEQLAKAGEKPDAASTVNTVTSDTASSTEVKPESVDSSAAATAEGQKAQDEASAAGAAGVSAVEAAGAEVKPERKKVLPPKRAIVPPVEAEPTFMDQYGQQAMLGGGLLAALLGVFGFSAYRKRKKNNDPITITPDSVTLGEEASNRASNEPSLADERPAQSYESAFQEADTFMAFNQNDKALVALDEALGFRPNDSDALARKAEIYSKLGRKEDLAYTLGLLSQSPDADRFSELVQQLEAQVSKSTDLEKVSQGLESMMKPSFSKQAYVTEADQSNGLHFSKVQTPVAKDTNWEPVKEDQLKEWVSSSVLESSANAKQFADSLTALRLPDAEPEHKAEEKKTEFAPELDSVLSVPLDENNNVSFDFDIPSLSPDVLTPIPTKSYDSLSLDMSLPDDKDALEPLSLSEQFSLDFDAPNGVDHDPTGVASTMFELAKAYLEMADREGAKELLIEVQAMNAGRVSEEAKKLLATLG